MNVPLDNLNDTQLIAKTIAGEQEAFGQLIHKYQPRLFNAMAHFLRNQAEAEDVVQDAFVLALTKLCLLYTSPSPRDKRQSRMPSSA